MAESKIIRTEYEDGTVVLSNARDKNTNYSYTLSKTTTFADGSPMTDGKCDGVMYRKKGNEYFARNYSGSIVVEWFGAKGDGITDDSAAFNKAISFASVIRGAIELKEGAVYVIDNIVINVEMIQIYCNSGNLFRFAEGYTGTSRILASAILKHKPNSSNKMLVVNAGGFTMRNISMDGSNNTATTFTIADGFEARLDTIRVAYGGGTGFDIQSAANCCFYNLYVDNCGSVSSPAVNIQPLIGADNYKSVNTLDIYGFHIERCKGVHLQIGRQNNVAGRFNYPEFLKIINLHIESPSDNGGEANTLPLVRIGNFRELTLISPFLYGGPASLIEYDQFSTEFTNQLGGFKILGGTFLGRDLGTTILNNTQPKIGLHLIKGNGVYVAGVTFDNIGNKATNDDTEGQAILIEGVFGDDAVLPPNTLKRMPKYITDSRSGDKQVKEYQSQRFEKNVRVKGHIETSETVTSLNYTLLSASGTGAPTVTINGNDTRGKIFFGSGAAPTAGSLFKVLFNVNYTRVPVIVFDSGNPLTASKKPLIIEYTDGFDVYFTDPPDANQVGTTFQLKYFVIE